MNTKYLLKNISKLLKRTNTKCSKTSAIKMRSLEKPFTVDETLSNSLLARHEGILKLVVKRFLSTAAKYNIAYDELLQVGRIGLIRGYEWWRDHQELDLKISTVLAHAITWDLQDYLYSNFSVIRVPKSTLNKKMEALKSQLMSIGRKLDVHNKILPVVISSDNEKETDIFKMGKDPYEDDQFFLQSTLNSIIATLPLQEQQIVQGIFFDKKTFSKLAEELQISKDRVKQIKDDVLKKLRKPSVMAKLRDFYE